MPNFRSEHEQLRASMTSFATMMDETDDANHAGLLKERMLFSRLFTTHLAAEQDALSRASTADPSLLPIVQDYRERIGRLRADYSGHIQRWTPAEVRADWPAYRLAVLELQARLRETMEWEEKHLPV